MGVLNDVTANHLRKSAIMFWRYITDILPTLTRIMIY